MRRVKLPVIFKKINYYFLYIAFLILVASGTVIFITQNKEPQTKTFTPNVCRGQMSSDFKCWRDYYKQMVNDSSPKEALADAEKRHDTSVFIKDNCHEIAHTIGRAAGKKYPDISQAYTLGTDFCASGYYHGVMQAIVDTVGKDKIISKIDTICTPLAMKKQYGLPHYNCVHGLGHGVMTIEGNELFVALKDCDGLTGSWQQESCYSGVFMENIIGEIDPDHFTAYLKSDDPLYPCTAVEDKYKKMCYFLQTDHALIVEQADFNKVFDHCAGLGNEPYSIMCYRSLGRNASSYAKYDITKTSDYCLLGDTDNAERYCFLAAATDFAWHFQDDQKALLLCSSIKDLQLSNQCTQTVENFNYNNE